jgi:hypothetical protein
MAQKEFEFIGNGKAKYRDILAKNEFINLSTCMPVYLSLASSYISSLIQNNYIADYQVKGFNYPKIYSVADNLSQGNFTQTSVSDGSEVVFTYIIPYTYLNENFNTTITLINNIDSKSYYYTIPKELTYDSNEEAAVYFSFLKDEYYGQISIPKSFVGAPLIQKKFYNNPYLLKFSIIPNDELKYYIINVDRTKMLGSWIQTYCYPPNAEASCGCVLNGVC